MALLLRLLGLAIASSLPAQQLLTPETLVQLQRVGELALAPGGKHLLFTVRTPDLASNRSKATVYLLDTAAGSKPVAVAEGGAPVWRRDAYAYVT